MINLKGVSGADWLAKVLFDQNRRYPIRESELGNQEVGALRAYEMGIIPYVCAGKIVVA
jgi:hypothetical protein